MTEQSQQKTLRAAIFGAIASVLFTTIITIWGELHAPLKNWLAATFSHHWLGKSILSVAVFVFVALISYYFSSKQNENDVIIKRIWLLFTITMLSTLTFIGFYLFEYFK